MSPYNYNSPADGEVASHLKWIVFHSHNRLRQLSTQCLLLSKLETFFFYWVDKSFSAF
jgi:hypothetical protein